MKIAYFIMMICSLFATKAYAQTNIVSEKRTVDNFTGIRVANTINVIITEGNSSTITIEASAEALPTVDVKVQGDILDISLKGASKNMSYLTYSKATVYVSATNLSRLEASTMGRITGQATLRTSEMKIRVDSNAKITANIVTDKIDCSADSGASVDLSGSASYAKVSADSMGSIDMTRMTVTKADVKADSMGKVNITVKEELKAHADSMGEITYHGNPSKVDLSSDSMGSVKKEK